MWTLKQITGVVDSREVENGFMNVRIVKDRIVDGREVTVKKGQEVKGIDAIWTADKSWMWTVKKL